MRNLFLLLAVIMTGMNMGCITYRNKTEIRNEASLKTTAQSGNGLYRLVEFRFRDDLEGNTGKEQIVDGEALTAWLAQEYPKAFSTAPDATPLIVRQSMMRTPPEGFLSSYIDIIVTSITLYLWPASMSRGYKFETAIQLPDESYTGPFVWHIRYTEHRANTIVAYLCYPSSKGYGTVKTENTMAKLQQANKLQRTILSRKSTEEENRRPKRKCFGCGETRFRQSR